MYGWIWRKLPYGVAGKLAGIALVVAGIGGVLWYGAFPIIDRHLPNNNVQVTQPNTDTFTAPPTPVATPSVTLTVKLPK
jgi:hypothetical protein